MIADKIENIGSYRNISDHIGEIENYMKDHDIDAMENGVYVISPSVYFTVKEYRPRKQDQIRWESHRKYIDLQYLVRGKELMGYVPAGELEVAEAYDEEKDCIFYKEAERASYIKMKEGLFAMLLPQDAHFPSFTDGSGQYNKKIIFKIEV